MHTLFDFVTHIKGVEYIASLSFIAMYLVFTEFLKAKPFSTLLQAGKDDIDYIKSEESGHVFKTVTRVIAAPFIGMAYIVMLPFAFVYALVRAIGESAYEFVGRELSLGWRPVEAYLMGRKGKREKGKGSTKGEEKK